MSFLLFIHCLCFQFDFVRGHTCYREASLFVWLGHFVKHCLLDLYTYICKIVSLDYQFELVRNYNEEKDLKMSLSRLHKKTMRTICSTKQP